MFGRKKKVDLEELLQELTDDGDSNGKVGSRDALVMWRIMSNQVALGLRSSSKALMS